jgi:hypothetical protein
MSSNETPFLKVMLEVLDEGKRSEALFLKQLSAMYSMETDFSIEWLRDYFGKKGEAGYQAGKVKKALADLMGGYYTDLLVDKQIKVAEARQDPDKRMKKERAVAQVQNLQVRTARCITALAFLRLNPLTDKGININNLNKTASFHTAAGVPYNALTFLDIETLGKTQIAEHEWEGPKVETSFKKEPTGEPKQEGDKLLVATVQATEELIRKADTATMSKEAVIMIIQLAKTALKKQFGNSKGKIELEDLAIDFSGLFIHKDGKPVCLIEQKKVA